MQTSHAIGVTAGGASASAPPRALARVVRGRPDDPAWSRPALLSIAALAAALVLWSLTRNGWANTYYAGAVYAGSRSWSAMFFNATDLSRYVAIDKTPLAIWMMSLSARVFGFSSFSMLLPNALCAVGSVFVAHDTVRRTLGHRAAAVAALLLALTPVSVLMGRFNNPDALLVLLLVGSAWALVRALESGRTRHLLLCGALVGLAFNTKMLQAFLVVPGLALAFLIAGRGSVRRRLAQLAAGGATMALVSAAWVTTVMAFPASRRPFVGDTTSNSWWDLIFKANGLNRVGSSGGPGGGAPPGGGGPPGAGPGGGGGFGGHSGPLRLFNDQLGGQIGWLLPLAALGLAAGLWLHRRGPRTDRRRGAYVLWGGWAVVHVYVFSFSLNLFHPYYGSALAPAVAVLAGGGLVELWDRSRSSRVAAVALAIGVAGTAVLAAVILHRTAGFVPWLRWVVLAAGLAAAVAILVLRLAAPAGRALRVVAAASVLVAVLGGPAAYSIATTGHSVGGGDPLAGPAQAGGGGFGFGLRGRPPGAGGLPGAPPPGALPGGRPPGGPGGPGAGAADKRLVSYLKTHRGGARYLVAAEGSMTAAPIALAARAPVITMGGFMGGDPAPTVAELRGLVRRGELRYVLTRGAGGPGGGAFPAGPPPGAAGNPARRGGSPGAARTQARDAWVRRSCRAVTLAGGSAASGLYDCAGAG